MAAPVDPIQAAENAIQRERALTEELMADAHAEFVASGRPRVEVTPERRAEIRAEVRGLADKYTR